MSEKDIKVRLVIRGHLPMKKRFKKIAADIGDYETTITTLMEFYEKNATLRQPTPSQKGAIY